MEEITGRVTPSYGRRRRPATHPHVVEGDPDAVVEVLAEERDLGVALAEVVQHDEVGVHPQADADGLRGRAVRGKGIKDVRREDRVSLWRGKKKKERYFKYALEELLFSRLVHLCLFSTASSSRPSSSVASWIRSVAFFPANNNNKSQREP